MSLTLKMKSPNVIKARLGIQNGGPIHAFFTETCYKAMDKYVPMDEGNLRTNVDVKTDEIIYESPYAHAQYVGYTKGPVVNYTTPGTGPYWDERMWSAEKEHVVKQVQNYMDSGGSNGI